MNINTETVTNNVKKVLFVANVVKTHIMVFHLPYLEYFKKNGYEVHVAARNDYEIEQECEIPNCDIFYNLPFERSPLRINNFFVLKELKKIIVKNKYEIIHCHTPTGGVLTRLAAIEARGNGTKVIYTAHGFHFYKGAPFINWLLYYPIEKWLARYTDVLITINKEDYKRARSTFKAGMIEYVPGVGINIDKLKKVKVNKEIKRKEIGVPKNSFVLLSVGELNKNKNHEVVIRALARINDSNVHYVICSQGLLANYLKKLSEDLKIDKQVHLLGYRQDILEICNACDLFIFPSFREGLSVALMEAMASGLPVICSNIRGNTDLIENGRGGYLVDPTNIIEISEKINQLRSDCRLREMFANYNQELIVKYSINNVINKIVKIYKYISD